MPKCVSLLFVAAVALFYAGCNISDAGCVSDDECREGRICSSGVCTGLVDLETEPANGSTNNVAGNNIPSNNSSTNNTPNNDGSTNNIPANNMASCSGEADCSEGYLCDLAQNECVPMCESAAECDDAGAPICSWRDGEEEELVCQAAQMCMLIDNYSNGDSCGQEWDCGRFPLFLDCRRDGDETQCACVHPELGPQEFEYDGDLCSRSAQQIADTINVTCGWRLPTNF
jgi:hypothetical protein